MALGNLFNLAKLTIEAYSAPTRSSGLTGQLEVQYNPETLSTKHESVYNKAQGVTTGSSKSRYSHSKSGLLTVALVFDGTNVSYMGIEQLLPIPTVGERIRQFLQTCYLIESETHEPAYLRLKWGKGVLEPSFDCRLQSVDIKYSAFDRDGSPLRAELNAVFTEDLDPKKKFAIERLCSPDVTHRRVVRSGDTLPLLCREIYGSAKHYLRVAEANGLDEIRYLTPGRELVFPPFERQGKR